MSQKHCRTLIVFVLPIAILFSVVGCSAQKPIESKLYPRPMLFTVAEMEEMIEIMRKDPGTFGTALYCKGEVIDAQQIPGQGCTLQDCRSEWVTTPPKIKTDFCDAQGNCPLKTNTWYPVTCSNFYFVRCEVMLSNISACM